MSKLEVQPTTSEVISLQNTAKILSKYYCLGYKKFVLHTSLYDKLSVSIPDTADVEVRIPSSFHLDAPPHIF